MLANIPNRPSKLRTKNWIEMNGYACGTYNTNSQIKFKTSMLKSSLCDYSDAYLLVSWTISVQNGAAADAAANNTSKMVISKNCALFTDYISEINNTQVNNIKDIDIVMLMYNLNKYSINFITTSGNTIEMTIFI